MQHFVFNVYKATEVTPKSGTKEKVSTIFVTIFSPIQVQPNFTIFDSAQQNNISDSPKSGFFMILSSTGVLVMVLTVGGPRMVPKTVML